MLQPQILHSDFVNFLNEQKWESDTSGMCFDLDPRDDISIFGRAAFEAALEPAIFSIAPGGFTILFSPKDFPRLEELGVRFSNYGNRVHIDEPLDYLEPVWGQ